MPRAIVLLILSISPFVAVPPGVAGDVGLTFWTNLRPMSQPTCRARAEGAIAGAGLSVVATSDWWVYGAGDGHTAFTSCTGLDANTSRVHVSVASLPGAANVNDMPRRIVALLDDPNARRYPAPTDVTNYAGITWWADFRDWTMSDCQRRSQRALEGAGMTVLGANDWYAGGENGEVDAYVTCSPHGGRIFFMLAVSGPPGVVIEDDLETLVDYVDNPGNIPTGGGAGAGGFGGGGGGGGAGGGGGGAQQGADLTRKRTASMTCKGATGVHDVNDVRFTLASATSVRVLANHPAGEQTWWIVRPDHGGTVVANVDDGVVVTAPPGSDMESGFVALPAGNYVFHVDCNPAAVGTVTADIMLPDMPRPSGPTYLVSAEAGSDRVMLLTAAQTVKFVDQPTTGSIIDFARTVLWSRDAGETEAWSTRDLLPVGHCIHGEWPDGPDRTFAIEFVGPPQPQGKTTTLTATSRAVTGGVEQGRGVQFRLDQPQVVRVLDTKTGWIIDSQGHLWFNVVDGEIQSGSSWVQSPGRDTGVGAWTPGVLLPAGTFHFAVSSATGTAKGQVQFVGESLDEFPWPAQQTHWCFPDLHDTIKLPPVGTRLSLGGIPEAIKECWPRESIKPYKWSVGDEGGMVTHETHLGEMRNSDQVESLWVEIHPDRAEQRDYEEFVQRRSREGELTPVSIPGSSWTAYLRAAESTVMIDEDKDGWGPMTVYQRFEMRCGRLQVSGAAGQFTGARWTRGDHGPEYDAAVAEAELRSRGPAVQRQTVSLIQRIVGNLEKRGLCRD